MGRLLRWELLEIQGSAQRVPALELAQVNGAGWRKFSLRVPRANDIVLKTFRALSRSGKL